MHARLSLAALVLLLASPVHAQEQGRGAAGQQDTSRNLRSFIIRNTSDKVISEVSLASTKDGADMYSSKDQIRPNHAANVRVDRENCLAAVRVKFQDGSDLKAEGLNDCKMTSIVVDNGKIALQSSAVE